MKKSDRLAGEEVSAILNGGNGSTACAADGPPDYRVPRPERKISLDDFCTKRVGTNSARKSKSKRWRSTTAAFLRLPGNTTRRKAPVMSTAARLRILVAGDHRKLSR